VDVNAVDSGAESGAGVSSPDNPELPPDSIVLAIEPALLVIGNLLSSTSPAEARADPTESGAAHIASPDPILSGGDAQSAATRTSSESGFFPAGSTPPASAAAPEATNIGSSSLEPVKPLATGSGQSPEFTSTEEASADAKSSDRRGEISAATAEGTEIASGQNSPAPAITDITVRATEAGSATTPASEILFPEITTAASKPLQISDHVPPAVGLSGTPLGVAASSSGQGPSSLKRLSEIPESSEAVGEVTSEAERVSGASVASTTLAPAQSVQIELEKQGSLFSSVKTPSPANVAQTEEVK
jgi:hypothetical protein